MARLAQGALGAQARNVSEQLRLLHDHVALLPAPLHHRHHTHILATTSARPHLVAHDRLRAQHSLLAAHRLECQTLPALDASVQGGLCLWGGLFDPQEPCLGVIRCTQRCGGGGGVAGGGGGGLG